MMCPKNRSGRYNRPMQPNKMAPRVTPAPWQIHPTKLHDQTRRSRQQHQALRDTGKSKKTKNTWESHQIAATQCFQNSHQIAARLINHISNKKGARNRPLSKCHKSRPKASPFRHSRATWPPSHRPLPHWPNTKPPPQSPRVFPYGLLEFAR